jgi:hypothetical protein
VVTWIQITRVGLQYFMYSDIFRKTVLIVREAMLFLRRVLPGLSSLLQQECEFVPQKKGDQHHDSSYNTRVTPPSSTHGYP